MIDLVDVGGFLVGSVWVWVCDWMRGMRGGGLIYNVLVFFLGFLVRGAWVLHSDPLFVVVVFHIPC